ncbi:hypothetical protein MGN01_46370 [Methylobacterium gnaphalii]|uniref:histidine kinase n=2 Tax=Methylobacterium gnaphalii TaxID=1010610 RepID=A0A512JS96_9HYPH|nr:hypothetical protein MGN01_46370 [Methylobacterium gnaphalii]GLS51446.1 hypothetical protein GCM10007885_43030 [Methylobacterium gnaphalii]
MAADLSGLANGNAAMLGAAVERTQMPMIVTDPHGPDNPIVFANDAFARMTGYARDEIVGRNCRFLQGPGTGRQAVSDIREALAEHREISVELLNYRRDGSSFWNAMLISPIHDPQGELAYFVASQFDASHQRHSEEALRQRQAIAALGPLTSSLAHDFTNLLQVISGYADVVQSQVAGGAPDLARLGRAGEAIRTATDKAARLTHQLLAFSRRHDTDGLAVDLNALIQSLDAIIARTLGDGIAFLFLPARDIWPVHLDPMQAETALLNILINAREATPKGGRVTIETRNVGLRDRRAALIEGVPAGDYVEISVSDTGNGMRPDVLARAMEPFFTTKDDGLGNGLGLATVNGFIRRLGGAVRITSQAGDGSRVRLLLPAAPETVSP